MRPPVKRGGKFVPTLCNIIGTLILLAVIGISIPLALPRFLGYEAFNVVSGSMEPALPVGSLVYVERVEPSTVAAGDVIAFESAGSVITHRVVENRTAEGEFVTKGDANELEDFTNTQYRDLIGRVKYHIPVLGNYMMIYYNQVAKIYLLCIAACGVIFNILAGRIRAGQEERYQEALLRYKKWKAEQVRAEQEELQKGE